MKTIKKILSLWIILLVFQACSNNKEQHNQPQVNKRDTVTIQMMAFHPDTLTISSGDTIVWINKDLVAHDISNFPDREWHSDTIRPQNSFEKIFSDHADYFCSIHPTMKGVIKIKK